MVLMSHARIHMSLTFTLDVVHSSDGLLFFDTFFRSFSVGKSISEDDVAVAI